MRSAMRCNKPEVENRGRIRQKRQEDLRRARRLYNIEQKSVWDAESRNLKTII